MEVIRDSDVMICPNSSYIDPPLEIQADSQGCDMTKEKSRKSLRNRPSINYRQFDNSSDEDSDLGMFEDIGRPVSNPKRGVIRGCSDCANCQKVLVRWRPGDACRPVLDDAPVFYPSEEDFKDTLKYIENIRSRAEPYGICRIVPPSSWKPPCPLKEKDAWENSKFSTRVQRVDLLQKRHSIGQMSKFSGVMRKRRRLLPTGTETGNTNGNSVKDNEDCHSSSAETFGFEPGPYFTLESFQKYAGDFKQQYFNINDGASDKDFAGDHPQRQWEPSEEDIEGEYWRMVEKPTEAIEVLYGADLETGEFGSGFPKASSTASVQNSGDKYVNSGWNLNNFPRLTGSVLAFENEDISGVLVPWLYIGMCFSSFCWHVEDHHFYSLNYMHWGSPKIWYGVPGRDAEQLEAVMKKHLPDLFEEQPDLLHKLVTQFSPSILRSEGVPVYRCVQHSGEFVLTFPRAYHSGFNCGFNCAEAVNVAPVDWLPHGQNAVELYRGQGRKISVSHDKLLLGTAREAVRAQWDMLFLKKTTSDSLIWKNICGQDKILVKALKERVEIERARREHLGSSPSRKMDSSFDANGDNECLICHYDLHLSAVGCSCSPDKFACLDHAKSMCSCDWNTRSFLFRYEIHELNILIDALGGKLSAVHRWGISDLGLSLRAYVTKPKSQVQARAGELTSIEEKKRMNINQGTLSNTTSCNQNGCNQEGNERKAVKDNQSSITFQTSLEKGTGTENFQLAKGGSSFDLGTLDARNSLSGKVSSKDTIQGGPLDVPYLGGQPIIKGADTAIRFNNVKEIASLVNNNVAGLDGKECKGSLQRMKEEFTGISQELSAGAKEHDVKVITSHHRDQVIGTHETGEAFIKEHDDLLQLVGEVNHPSSRVKEEGKSEVIGGNMCVQQDHPVTAGFCLSNSQNTILTQTSIEYVPEVSAPKMVNVFNNTPSLSIHGNVEATCASKVGKVEVDPHTLGLRCDKQQPVTSSQSCLPIITDRYSLPKGPRIAKVVRRINCNVEALEFGTVLSGRLWSTSQAIFPKGYRSRVKYFNILDPSQMCYYVSQILDGGCHGPLFMVQVEQCLTEVFINVSAAKCWDMVRERVNQEIRRIHLLGKFCITSLQLPGSVDGLEMFGLTSPTIIQEIEAMDRNNISLEYWSSRPQNQKPPIVSEDTRIAVKEPDAVHDSFSSSGSITILQSLIKKATFDELQLLHQLLTNNRLSPNAEIIQILNKALLKLSKPT